ncbi:MAG TPA: 50S ribosomal protein L32 [Clostridia bacterium]|nr:50S ribosomal protein L32 [Clostridia bacterium]
MAVPKMKVFRARSRKRRTHYKITLPAIVPCPKCKEMRLAHHVCKECGTYNGVQVLAMDKEKKKA